MAKAKGNSPKSSRKRVPARGAPTPRGVSARPSPAPMRVVVPATSVDTLAYVRALIRNVPDFPNPGIVCKDITPLRADPKGFHIVIDSLAERFIGEHIDAIVGIESRGFIFGSALAARLNASFVPVRKTGKLPAAVDRISYDLEYGRAELEMHKHCIPEGAKVLVVDDLLATGGTAVATPVLGRMQGGLDSAFALFIHPRFL